MPTNSCQTVAYTFKLLYEAKSGVTDCKARVAETLKGKELEIARLRQRIKHRAPRPMPRNLIGAMT